MERPDFHFVHFLKEMRYVQTNWCGFSGRFRPYDRRCGFARIAQGRIWGYPGNCQFSTYQQCMITASGTDAYCDINPRVAFREQGRYR